MPFSFIVLITYLLKHLNIHEIRSLVSTFRRHAKQSLNLTHQWRNSLCTRISSCLQSLIITVGEMDTTSNHFYVRQRLFQPVTSGFANKIEWSFACSKSNSAILFIKWIRDRSLFMSVGGGGGHLIFRRTKGGSARNWEPKRGESLKTLEGFGGGTTQICLENEDIGGGGGGGEDRESHQMLLGGITAVK